MIEGCTNGELGNESQSWVGIGSKNRTGVQSSELLHEVITGVSITETYSHLFVAQSTELD